MMNILDVDAAALEAEAVASEWEREFVAKWNEPLLQAELLADFLMNPDPENTEMIARVRKMKTRVKESHNGK